MGGITGRKVFKNAMRKRTDFIGGYCTIYRTVEQDREGHRT